MVRNIAAGLIALALSASCSGGAPHGELEWDGEVSDPGAPQEREDFVAGELVHEIAVSETGWVRFHQQPDGALLTEFAADIDQDPEFLELSLRALEEDGALAIYQVLQPGEPTPEPLQDAVLLHEEYVRQAVYLRGQTPASQGDAEPETEGGKGSSGPSSIVTTGEYPGARTESVEPPWDWNNEARWWRDNFCSRHPEKPHRRCHTNQAWRTSGAFYSYQLSAQGMAASHVATAQFKGWRYECGQCWLIATCCSWKVSWDVILQPRHWRAYSLQNLTDAAVEVFGQAPSERTHVSWQYRSSNFQ